MEQPPRGAAQEWSVNISNSINKILLVLKENVDVLSFVTRAEWLVDVQ